MKKFGLRRWMPVAFLISAAFSLGLTGCSGNDGSQGPSGLTGATGQTGATGAPGAEGPAATTGTPVTVQGNVAGAAAGVAQAAALTEPMAVVMVDEAGNQVASQIVTPANGQFSLAVPSGHVYVLVIRAGTSAGPTTRPQ